MNGRKERCLPVYVSPLFPVVNKWARKSHDVSAVLRQTKENAAAFGLEELIQTSPV